MKKNNKIKNNSFDSIYVIIFFAIFSLIFLSIYSCCTSIFYNKYADIDGSTFQVIGKSWLNGYLPYRDTFDHKGPIIYFINMLGFFIGRGSNVGIMILQTISMTFTTFGLYKINSIKIKNKIINIFLVIFVICIWLTLGYETGNKTEEWCMPFLVFSLYYILKFFENYHDTRLIKLNHTESIFFGITAGFCFMTKFTNFVPVMPFIFCIYLLLFLNKQYKELFKNIISFLCGLILISLPFFIYFYIKGTFYDFIYCSFLFQYKYIKIIEQLQDYSIDIIRFIRYYYPLWLILPIAVKYIIKKRYYYAISLLLVFILESYVFYTSLRGYYYVAILMPIFAIILNEIYEICLSKKIEASLIILIPIAVICIMLFKYNRINFNINNDQYLNEVLDKIDTDSLVSYDLNVDTTNYIELFCKKNTGPKYKYYFQQSFFSRDNDEAKKIYDTYENGDARYILVYNRVNSRSIDSILNSRYREVFNNVMYKLYELK